MTDQDLNTPEWNVICDALEAAELAIKKAADDIYCGRLSPADARDAMHAAIVMLEEGAR